MLFVEVSRDSVFIVATTIPASAWITSYRRMHEQGFDIEIIAYYPWMED